MNKQVEGTLIRAFVENLAQARSVLSPVVVELMVNSLGQGLWALAQEVNLMLHLGLDILLEDHEVDCLVALLVSMVYAAVPVAAVRAQVALAQV